MPYKPSSEEEEKFLKNFDPAKYQNPGVAADTAVFAVKEKELFLLLIERGGYPYKGCWALPGGFVDMDEDILGSAKRELEEEAGLRIDYIEQAAVWDKPDRDPRQRVITVSCIALIDDTASIKAGDDAAKAEWFKINSYSKAEGEEQTTVSFSLSGPAQIAAKVAYPNNRIQQITCVQSGGLAFDHAESIVTSIELLKRRVEIIAPLSFGKQKADEAARIINNI